MFLKDVVRWGFQATNANNDHVLVFLHSEAHNEQKLQYRRSHIWTFSKYRYIKRESLRMPDVTAATRQTIKMKASDPLLFTSNRHYIHTN